jgi:hypothetical protein
MWDAIWIDLLDYDCVSGDDFLEITSNGMSFGNQEESRSLLGVRLGHGRH